MVSTYSEVVRVKFISPAFSKGGIFNTLIFLGALIIPYLIAYRSQGFWVKLERFKEQPEIQWKHEILLILDVRNENQQENLIWTTLPGLKTMLGGGEQLAPFISSREADVNFDSLKDFLEIELTIPLPNGSSVYGLHFILLFDYKLHNYAKLWMEGMILLQGNYGRSGNHFEFFGDLGISQKEPLWNRYVDKRYNYDVIPRFSSNLQDYSLPTILSRYTHRNVSTVLKNSYSLWLNNKGQTEAETLKNNLVIKGRINYAQETYECWSGLGEVLKWAWIQYFSIFIIVYAILKQFQALVHKARIFDSYLITPWEKQLGTQPKF